MEANPLTGPPPAAESAAGDSAQRVISLVSNAPASQITGLEEFLAVFNGPEVKAEVNPFRHVIQRKQRRSMGGKFAKGLTHEVTENVEINPNEDLFGLRRWLGGIRSDPASVMLLHVNKLRDEPLAAPLIFSEMLRTGRPVLVTGTESTMRSQLLSRMDLSFQRVPAAVEQNPSLRTLLLARLQRRKGFISGVRPLLDLEFLPPAIVDKLTKINAGGDPSELGEAETINITLLADLASRYRHALQQYRDTLQNSSLNVQQLTSLFEILLADLPLADAVKAFDEFLGPKDERPETVRSKAELFGLLNRYVNQTEGSSRGLSRSQKVDAVMKRTGSVVIEHRAKVDATLFARCAFIFNREPEEKALHQSLEPLQAYLDKTAAEGQSAINEEFKARMGQAVYDLVLLANQDLEQAKVNGVVRQRVACHLLPLFRMKKFQAGHLVHISDQNRATLLDKTKFLNLFRSLPITVEDLQEIGGRLRNELNHNEVVSEGVRRSTLDVLVGHARDREKALREIYVVNAAQELVNYPFHVGEIGLAPLERLCGLTVLMHRFGFEVAAKPVRPNSIGLFDAPGFAPLGKLNNEPSVLSRAYTALVGMRVERNVRRAIDRKIGYLQQTFGDNFFEVIYQQVVARHDLPLSRNQLAWFVQRRGLLGSLMEKGWRSESENELVDSFLTLEGPHVAGRKPPERNWKEFDNFEERFQDVSRRFKQLLNELKGAADKDPNEEPRALVWSLYKRGIYNLNRPEAKEVLRRTSYYNTLKDLIAQISSENYSVFTKDIQNEGVKIYVHPRFHYLLTIGQRFAFLVESKVVRYQLLASPAQKPDELDTLSRTFHDNLERTLGSGDGSREAQAVVTLGELMRRVTETWHDYSRYLAFALLDRVLSATVMKELEPGKVLPQNLWYVPDPSKLGLGPALSAQKSVPFTKILQTPENMGSIQKNPRSCSTTIDDFTIEVHKINHLRDELETIHGIAADVLDIIQNLTHERAESQLVLNYEQGLTQLVKILDKPLRHVGEPDVMLLHKVASHLQNTLRAFYNTPGSQKDLFVQRVQNQLRSRRSDGHTLRLNFSDAFILEMTQIKVMQRRKVGDETVSRQRKVEVEVDQKHQTLSARVREVIRIHDILAQKRHVVFSPEGQKRKQVDYMMDIMETLLALRGNQVTFYMDTSMLTEEQVRQLATRIKPHNFFRMDELKPEPPQGVAVSAEKDPLTGRLKRSAPEQAQPGAGAD